MIGRVRDFFERKIFEPLALRFSFLGPNSATFLGFLCSLASAYFFFNWHSQHFLLYAAFFLLLSGFFDALDGAIARVSGKVTKFGGFLDSIVDRLSEIAVFVSIISSGACDLIFGMLALAFSIMVSYARARSEALGVSQLGVGIAERPERMLLLACFAALANFWGIQWLNFGVILIAFLAAVTFLQRAYYAGKKLE